MTDRRILVTAALPYANGHIHLGHLVEYIQTDIWVRFQKLQGNRCLFVCADDTHGTAIMIRARHEGRSESELIAAMHRPQPQDIGPGQGLKHFACAPVHGIVDVGTGALILFNDQSQIQRAGVRPPNP